MDFKASGSLNFQRSSPFLLLVPSLEHNSKVIGESLDLIKYIDSNFEGPSLLPDDPEKRKFAEELIAYSDTFVPEVYGSFKRDAQTLAGAQFDYLEKALHKFDDGPFFLGHEFSQVDIAYVPFIERFQIFLKEVFNYDITSGRLKLAKWIEEVNKLGGYEETKVFDPKRLVEYYKNRFLIYQYEEEEERSQKWKGFLDNQEESSQPHASEKLDVRTVDFEVRNQQQTFPVHVSQEEGDGSVGGDPVSDIKTESDFKRELPAYLSAKSCQAYTWAEIRASLSRIDHLMSFRVKKTPKTKVELSTGVHNHLATIKEPEESEEENVEERSVNEESGDGTNTSAEVGTAGSGVSPELSFPWKELEFLVRGGVPRDLRGEFNGFLTPKIRNNRVAKAQLIFQVWQAFVGVRARRLEKYYLDMLDPESDTGDGQENDESSLAEEKKRRSKESVHVPEKLRKQIEKDLPRTFPGHPALDEKGRNSLRRLLIAYARHNPDVGYCQAMNFFAGPAVVTTKDAGDAITLFQSLTGSTFDSSQLVLTACMGFLNVTEDRLLALREKHRPAVLAVTQERSMGGPVKKDPKGLASKLYSFKHDPESFITETKPEERSGDKKTGNKISDSNSNSTNLDEFLNSLNIDSHVDSLPGVQEQVVRLKVELCRTLEDKRAATLRAEELETALMEMVKEDNRRQLSARVLMRVEQEQKVTEDARIAAEQDVAAQKYALHVLQEKYEKAMASVTQMEKRVVMAESMLEATLQYESGQVKALSSPRSTRPDSPQGVPTKRGLLSFGLGWRDRNKAKPSNLNETKPADEGPEMSSTKTEANGQQE
ncbi:hypothetical protein RND71_031808 [Anisodus tanguticus]|uniref:Rab-GAP TBC domain-containing protein n=1 Tax=Anisodus tanguticus TaxID=243964 RepID=A0AAE1RD96_9SOLA|nr:hypothetical protein RND71_031808 [Anisodus tanguticus]